MRDHDVRVLLLLDLFFLIIIFPFVWQVRDHDVRVVLLLYLLFKTCFLLFFLFLGRCATMMCGYYCAGSPSVFSIGTHSKKKESSIW
jgi:hypothetical protein